MLILTFGPQVYAVVETTRDARSLGCHAQIHIALAHGPLSSEEPQFNSLSEILCQQLHQAGLEVLPSATARDAIGSSRICRCIRRQIDAAAKWAALAAASAVAAAAATAQSSLTPNQLLDLS